ncbi:hypothetical protein PRIC1_000281 [Phytophthora ramorum]
MLAAGRFVFPRRPIWQVSRHHHRPSRRCSRTHRVFRTPQAAPESTGALLALLATMCGVQVYSSPVTGTLESADFVARHFETSWSQVKRGRAYTLVTSTLYTPVAGAALLNVVWLAIAGRHVCRAVGNARFLSLFIGSGTLANVVSVTSGGELRDDPVFPKLQLPGGASCAVDCVVTLNALMYPPSRVALTRRWRRWPLWLFSAMFLTRDEGERPPWVPDSAPREGHMTGVLCGLAAFLVLRRPPRYI